MADQTQITVFCTKYSLSIGIFPVTGHVTPDGYFSGYRGKTGKNRCFLGKRDWHATKEDALADFERRKANKAKSLEAQIKKIEIMQAKLLEA
jgi:hypothetical protein